MMRKISFCVLFFLLALFNTCFAHSEAETWMSRLSHSNSEGKRKEIREYVITHPDLAKQILFF